MSILQTVQRRAWRARASLVIRELDDLRTEVAIACQGFPTPTMDQLRTLDAADHQLEQAQKAIVASLGRIDQL